MMRALTIMGISLFVVVRAESGVGTGVTDVYYQEKEKVIQADQLSRTVMGSLYTINERMKTMSRKRDILNDKILGTESDAKALAKSAGELELQIKDQRRVLARRLRAMYMIGDEGVVRILFSSASAQDLDQSVKFLKLVSDRDLGLIRALEKNLIAFKKKKDRLNQSVRNLISLRGSLRNQESQLAEQQQSKTGLLMQLGSEKKRAVARLETLRREMGESGQESGFDTSFFEQKSQLPSPVSGEPIRRFGLIENEEYQYRLRHKGVLYGVSNGAAANAIFRGRVAFVGALDGYGPTVVVDHGDHYYTVYSRLAKIAVKEGATINSNEVVGHAGHTFYFEVRHFSDAVDPEHWLRKL